MKNDKRFLFNILGLLVILIPKTINWSESPFLFDTEKLLALQKRIPQYLSSVFHYVVTSDCNEVTAFWYVLVSFTRLH